MGDKRTEIVSLKTRSKLASFFDWFASFTLLVISLIFIYAAQIFLEQKLQAWANVFTSLGSVMLSLVSLHMGSKIQQAKSKKEEMKVSRKSEIANHQTHLECISNLIQQLSWADNLNRTGKENEGDLVRYRVWEKLTSLQTEQPSASNISEKSFRLRIGEAMDQVAFCCDGLRSGSIIINDAKEAINKAFSILREYEMLD